MLINGRIFGRRRINTIYLHMTFKQLTKQLQQDGWRAYYIPLASSLVLGHKLNKLANSNLIEVQVYEGQNVVFVRTIQIPIDVQDKNKKENGNT